MNRAVVFAVMGLASVASAATVTNTFDDPAGPIPANGINAFGVTFHFTDALNAPSDLALYGNEAALSFDHVLDGPTDGILRLEFLQAVTSLSFDFMLGIVEAEVSEGVTVVLSGPGGSSVLTAPTGIPDGLFGMGVFNYRGFAITEAVLTFAGDTQFFAIDNLAYNQLDPQGLSAVPEPGTVGLVISAVLLAALRLKRGRRSVAR
jgi:hypothetical protein